MIVVKLACLASLSTHLTSSRTVDLKPVARYGACAHIHDDAADAAQVRHRVRSLPRWTLLEDDSAEGQEVLAVLRPSPASDDTYVFGDILGLRPHVPSWQSSPDPVPPTWAEEMRASGVEMPEWVLNAARNGWSYPDVSGADWPDVRAPRTGLSPIDLGLCKPPPGWSEVGDPSARPWHLAGFVPPEGWTAPMAANVIVPETVTAAPADERFVPAPEDTPAPDATDGADAEVPEAALDAFFDHAAIVRDLAIALHISHDLAQDVVERAKGVPRAESGGAAPRGKINSALRSKGVSLDVDAYNIIVPLLNLQT